MAASKSETATCVSIPKLVALHARTIPNSPAYREKEYGIWQSWSWAEAAEEIEALALGFLDMGLAKGDHIALIGRNRPYFYWAMVAAQSVGATPVPIYQDAVAEELLYVLDHCGARFIIAENQEQVDKVQDVQEKLSALEQVIFLESRGMRKYDRTNLHDYREVQDNGRAHKDKFTEELTARQESITGSDTCAMLYTSGTTGRPKGVVLSNDNIIKTSEASCKFDNLSARDSVLAYLPMAWVGDFIFSLGQACWSGFCVSCPENTETMQADLKEIGPSYFFAPPRYFEGVLTNVMIRMEDASSIKRGLFSFFMAHAQKVGGDLLDGKSISLVDRALYQLGQFSIFGPLKNSLGLSRVRIGYTAGEAIGPEIFDFYRSPGTFVKYYKNDKSTAETKDAEGWVATGDAGFIEADTGHLRIIDRAKDVGKMKSGSLFAPKYVENKLKFFPNILECVVFGADRDFCTAFINIDLQAVGNWAERNNVAYSSYQELAGHERVYEMIARHIDEVNISLADDEMLSGCQVHRFLILHKELDADDGELTRTRKVRRRVIEDKFHDLLTALYNGSSEIFTETEVTYEDGAKGSISATLAIADVTPVAQKGKAA